MNHKRDPHVIAQIPVRVPDRVRAHVPVRAGQGRPSAIHPATESVTDALHLPLPVKFVTDATARTAPRGLRRVLLLSKIATRQQPHTWTFPDHRHQDHLTIQAGIRKNPGMYFALLTFHIQLVDILID